MLVNQNFNNFKIIGTFPCISFIVATSNQGLLFFDKGNCTRLCSASNSYGLTKYGDFWYTLLDQEKSGTIYSFNIKCGGGFNFKKRIKGLHKGVHQIDFIKDKLFLTNTRANKILVYDVKLISDDSLPIIYKNFSDQILPKGPLDHTKYTFKKTVQVKRGKKIVEKVLKEKRSIHRYDQENYGHFNSIFFDGKNINILAHNVSSKTGRKSEVFVYNDKFEKENVIEVDGYNCHNIYTNNNSMIVCNSFYNNLYDYKKNKVLFQCDKFTRGLSISDDYIMVGGSPFKLNATEEERSSEDSSVYILDKDYNKVCEVLLYKCQVNEIRRVDSVDYCMSNFNEKI